SPRPEKRTGYPAKTTSLSSLTPIQRRLLPDLPGPARSAPERELFFSAACFTVDLTSCGFVVAPLTGRDVPPATPAPFLRLEFPSRSDGFALLSGSDSPPALSRI